MYWFCIITVTAIIDAAQAQTDCEDWIPWKFWVTNALSKGVYSVLGFLIVMCIVVETIKSKVKGGGSSGAIDTFEDAFSREEGGVMETISRSSTVHQPLIMATSSQAHLTIRKLFYNEGVFEGPEETNRIREQLKETQDTVALLREELEMTNKAKMELEDALETIDKDRTKIEDLLYTNKSQGILEIEKLKRETDKARRQLQQALNERDQLSKEKEALERESRIVASALRDNQLMDMKLEEARREISHLRRQLEAMKTEREAAAEVISQIMGSTNGQRAYQDMIKAKKSKDLDSDGKSSSEDPSPSTSSHLVDRKVHWKAEKATYSSTAEKREDIDLEDIYRLNKHKKSPSVDLEQMKVASEGDCRCLESPESSSSLLLDEDPSMADMGDAGLDDWEDDPSKPRLVTGSRAFRRFLECNTIFPGQE